MDEYSTVVRLTQPHLFAALRSKCNEITHHLFHIIVELVSRVRRELLECTLDTAVELGFGLLLLLLAMTVFPQIVLWLPHAMGYATQ